MKTNPLIRLIPFVALMAYWIFHLFGELKPGLTWQQVLVTDWYVTVLVLSLPIMLLAWFAYEKWRSLKDRS